MALRIKKEMIETLEKNKYKKIYIKHLDRDEYYVATDIRVDSEGDVVIDCRGARW